MPTNECARCKYFISSRGLASPDIWCYTCRREHWAEYGPIFQKRLAEHGDLYLAEMEVPPVYRSCAISNFESTSPELARVRDLVVTCTKNSDRGLYLSGPVGVGKTHLAAAAMLELRASNPLGSFRFVSVQELVGRCRNSFRKDEYGHEGESVEKILEPLGGLAVLTLDDLGAENSTEFARETLLLLVDRVYRARRTRLIVTSNYDLKELGKKVDARLADRLLQLCVSVRMNGTSYRQRIAARQAADLGRQRPSLAGSPEPRPKDDRHSMNEDPCGRKSNLILKAPF